MKKFLACLLSITILITSMFGITQTVFAGGWINETMSIEFDETVTRHVSSSNYYYNSYYYLSYEIYVPMDGVVNIYTESKKLISNPTYINYYSTSNPDSNIGYEYIDQNQCGHISSRDVYYTKCSANFKKGRYYIVFKILTSGYDIDSTFTYKPNISKISNCKVLKRNTNSLYLSWSKVSNASGYQIQMKSTNGYKTLAKTTKTNCKVENLSSAKIYKFRIRAYKKDNGKRYYGSWKYFNAVTKPHKVSIKTPSTNNKHQIIAKWNKVTRASGYQVQYCKNKNHSTIIATKTVSGQSKVSYVGNNFTRGRTYYVRVRAYKTVNGTRYYGAWSNVKSIKSK